MADYSYPVRFVAPVQIPGAPPMEVRPPAPIDYQFNIGSLAASAQYWTPVIDLGEPRWVRKGVFSVRADQNLSGCVIAALGSNNATPYAVDTSQWVYTPAEYSFNNIAWSDNSAYVYMTLQFVPVTRYVQLAFVNSSTDKTGVVAVASFF